MTALGKYMVAHKPTPTATGKTWVWRITTLDGDALGLVKWFGRWRCYTFYPVQGTVFNASCMTALAEFCETVTKDRS